MNAQYAEEFDQLKRENTALKRQIKEIRHTNINNSDSCIQTNNINSSDSIVKSNNNELEILHETVDRLSAVSLLNSPIFT